MQGAKLSPSAEEECCRLGECLLPVWLVALGTTKSSRRQTVDDLRQAIRCFHKRQHAHVCKRVWSGRRVHLKITTSAGSEKEKNWRACCAPNGDAAPHGLARRSARPSPILHETRFFSKTPLVFRRLSRFQRYSRMQLRYLHLSRVKECSRSVSISPPKLNVINICSIYKIWFFPHIFVLHSYRQKRRLRIAAKTRDRRILFTLSLLESH